MNEHVKSNQEMWDALTEINAASEYYDVEGFKHGKCTLQKIEREELGDVAGKSLLHLQCHFGLDTMSWARLGAKVTGADFSQKAITLAKSLSAGLNIPAEFVRCNIYDLPRHLSGQFDIVYTSIGVLCWLPDLQPWAELIAHFLKPGGGFYIYEGHPVMNIFDDAKDAREPRVKYPYFHSPDPEIYEDEGSTYASVNESTGKPSCEWVHSMADIINSLIAAGLQLEFLHEFPYISSDPRPFLTKGADGLWRYEAAPRSIPLVFSIKATRSQDGQSSGGKIKN